MPRLFTALAVPPEIAARYALEGAEPIRCDEENCRRLGVEVLRRPVATVEQGFVRHAPDALADELMRLYTGQAIRIAGGRFRLEREE